MTRILHNYSNVEDWDPVYHNPLQRVACPHVSCNHASINHTNWRIRQCILLQSWKPALFLNRGPAASGMDLAYELDALQHCLNQLEVLHGDVPFLGTAESIRHELFLQQYPGPNAMLHVNVLLPPHCYMENRRSHLDCPSANASEV